MQGLIEFKAEAKGRKWKKILRGQEGPGNSNRGWLDRDNRLKVGTNGQELGICLL